MVPCCIIDFVACFDSGFVSLSLSLHLLLWLFAIISHFSIFILAFYEHANVLYARISRQCSRARVRHDLLCGFAFFFLFFLLATFHAAFSHLLPPSHWGFAVYFCGPKRLTCPFQFHSCIFPQHFPLYSHFVALFFPSSSSLQPRHKYLLLSL